MLNVKRPAETLVYRYEFGAALGLVVLSTIASVTSLARGTGANLVVVTSAIEGRDVLVKWSGGVNGEIYLTTVRATGADGSIHEATGEIIVDAAGFTIPTGVSSRYLTGEEYVLRFGAAETIRLTDELKTGEADSGKLEAAIGDATDFADGYIGKLYAIPLLAAPRVVKSIVADLAREKLHKTRPTPEVTAAADRARSQLQDISAGRLTLPISGGGVVDASGDRTSVTSRDGSSAFGDQVAGFSLAAGYTEACWRL